MRRDTVIFLLLALLLEKLHAQSSEPATEPPVETLPTVTVRASADASADGLTRSFAGGQVARGGRVGILGNQDVMSSPFSSTSYTNELIQNQQARSVGDVLLNDPSVRVARGFGNFQEAYFIRGFTLSSDNVAYNGLYSLLPRQYIAAELFERVEVLRGATAFLNGANPGGDGIGGSINLLPKRAPNESLSQVTVGTATGSQAYLSTDLARRFGPDKSTGIRFTAAHRNGGTGVDKESFNLDLASIGLDWRSTGVRLSGDIGYQDNRLKRTRTNVTLSAAATSIPTPPGATSNWAQPWSYSNERDTFSTLRGEVDLDRNWTGWAAAGLRRSNEANSLANLTLTNATTGAGTTYRFDNTRQDAVDTGELGIRGKLRTGPVGHSVVASASYFRLDKKNAYGFSSTAAANLLKTNLFAPVDAYPPPLATFGNALDNPQTTGLTKLISLAVADTVSLASETVLLTAGARYQKLNILGYAYNTGSQTSDYEKSRTSPVIGALWKVQKSLSLYANYIEGLSQGETAPSTAANLGEQLAPYVSKQKEVGIKYDGGSVGASAAIFSTARPRAYVDAAKVFKAEGEDRHQGLELNVFGLAAPGVRILSGLTLLRATQLSTGSVTTDGMQVIGVPKVQGNLGAEWDVPFLKGLSVDARVNATGPVYANATNTFRLPGWTRLDVGSRFTTEIQGRVVTFRARLDNASGRDYWASSGGYPNSGYLVLGTPRTFTLSAAVDL